MSLIPLLFRQDGLEGWRVDRDLVQRRRGLVAWAQDDGRRCVLVAVNGINVRRPSDFSTISSWLLPGVVCQHAFVALCLSLRLTSAWKMKAMTRCQNSPWNCWTRFYKPWRFPLAENLWQAPLNRATMLLPFNHLHWTVAKEVRSKAVRYSCGSLFPLSLCFATWSPLLARTACTFAALCGFLFDGMVRSGYA